MKNWREVVVKADVSVLQVIDIIDQSTLQIALIVDNEGKLIGTVTDGDIRRGILKAIPVESTVDMIMNTHPISIGIGFSRESVLKIMGQKEIRQIPVVDEEGKLIGLELWQDVMHQPLRKNPVVLMAGGEGRRLGSLTANCPKPLLKVGDKPILQTILENFIEYGFHDFIISVNYRANMIEAHFGNGEKWGVQIRYIRECSPMGTAGSLKLIEPQPSEAFIVMNGDILTKVDFEKLLDFHQKYQSCATMCIRDYKSQVPYGVVQVDQHRLVAIHEKPVQHHFVSAGIYVFDPSIFELFPTCNRLDMPELFQIAMENKLQTSVFPIREYWIDIGRGDDFEKANGEYDVNFK